MKFGEKKCKVDDKTPNISGLVKEKNFHDVEISEIERKLYYFRTGKLASLNLYMCSCKIAK